jgi:hypothetical protein
MHLKLKRANRKRLASLSALGAGALGAVAIPANANDIVFSGVINVDVPYAVHQYTMAGPEGAGGMIYVNSGCQITCFQISSGVGIRSKPGKYGTQFRLLATGFRNSYAVGEPQDAIWGTAAGKSTKSASIAFHVLLHGSETKFTSADRYLLFRFQGGALKHDMYGWARMKVTLYPYPNYQVPKVELIDWAYDPSGIRLPAGYHGAGQSEPEESGMSQPSSLDTTGLPALYLGAPGLRRLRAARAAEAAKAAVSTPAH